MSAPAPTSFTDHVNLLDQANTVPQLRDLKNKALIALGAASRQKADTILISNFRALALGAERKLGQLLCAERADDCSEQASHGAERTSACAERTVHDINRFEEYRARQLAAMPEHLFNRLRTGEVTRTEAVRLMQADSGPDRSCGASGVATTPSTTTRMRYEKVIKDDQGNTEKFEIEVVSDGTVVPRSVMANYKALVKQITDGTGAAVSQEAPVKAQEQKRLLNLSYVTPKPANPNLKYPDLW